MANSSSFWRDGDDIKIPYTYSHNHDKKWVNWNYTAPYTAWKIIERFELILDTHSTDYTWQEFCMFSDFRSACVMRERV